MSATGPCTRCHRTDKAVVASKYADGKFCPSCYATIFNAGKEGKPVPELRPRKGSEINIGICMACDKAGVHIYIMEDGTRVCSECFEAAKIAEDEGVALPGPAAPAIPEPMPTHAPAHETGTAAVLVRVVCRDMTTLHRILAATGGMAVTVVPYTASEVPQ